MSYGSLTLSPQSFQDDLLRLCKDSESAQYGLDRFENLANSKFLTYNLDKSMMTIVGSKKARERLEKELLENPPMLYGQPLQVVLQATYLGDELKMNCAESVSATIRKRIGLTKKSIMEIKNVVEDCRSEVTGGIVTGLQLWESCVVPYILNNSSTWLDIRQSDKNILNKLQSLFLNTLLNTFNCPIPLMYLDLNILTMPMRILSSKLTLYHHIACLPERSVSKKIMKIQEDLNFPSLYEEISEFLTKHEIIDVTSYSKVAWKDLVKNLIASDNRNWLLESTKRYKKLDND